MGSRKGLLGLLWVGLQAGCYDGPGELEPEPGSPGGLCLRPENTCSEVFWTCEPVGAFCYNPGAPCQGILCGGHGECTFDEANGLPQCTCEPGYGNFEFSLYCESL